jgi:hypothetical protein
VLKSLILHPFLFALYPALALFSFNITQVPTGQLLMPLVTSVGLAFLLWSGMNLVFQEKRKSGLFVFLFLFLFFSYGHFQRALTLQGYRFGQPQYLLPLWGLLFLLATYLIRKVRTNLANHTLILNVVTAFLVLSSLVNIVPYIWQRRAAHDAVLQARPPVEGEAWSATGRNSDPVQPPDIYYLIFDRYANPAVLQETFDYDNQAFINYLTQKDFFIASESQANYPSTFLSLASSLNMTYLDSLQVIKNSKDHTLIYELLQDYRVWRFLKARGYKFIHLGDWFDPTRSNRFADINYNYSPLGLNGFAIMLLRTTVLLPAIDTFIGDINTQNRTRTLYKFEKLSEIPEMEGPKFVFAHMLLPHDPYIFGPDGQFLSEENTASKTEIENYLNQLTFTNQKIKVTVEAILAKSSTPPVIIIQSDEGPLITSEFLAPEFMNNTDWSQISPEQLEVHLKILNAYHFPGFDQQNLYGSISPVNSFRLVFNHYLGADFQLLEDKTFISQGTNLPYNFVEAGPYLSEQ